jgi:hypothetical protein
LRGSIKNKAVEEIRQMLEGVSISVKKIEDILGRQELYQKIISTITHQISSDLREPVESSSRGEGLTEDRLRQWRAELFLSYFRDIDRIQKTFRHDVIETYHRDFVQKMETAIGSSKVVESKEAMVRNKVLALIGEILLSVLEKYINRKSNIYLTIDKKVELLDKTLLV